LANQKANETQLFGSLHLWWIFVV